MAWRVFKLSYATPACVRPRTGPDYITGGRMDGCFSFLVSGDALSGGGQVSVSCAGRTTYGTTELGIPHSTVD